MIRPIVAVTITNPVSGRSERIYALIDSGADRDYLSTDLGERLGLITKEEWMSITTVKDTREEWTETTSLVLGSTDGQYEARIEDAIIGRFPAARDDLAPAKKDWLECEHMEGIEFEDIDAKVEALICIAHEETWVGWEVRRGKKGQPALMKTAFG